MTPKEAVHKYQRLGILGDHFVHKMPHVSTRLGSYGHLSDVLVDRLRDAQDELRQMKAGISLMTPYQQLARAEDVAELERKIEDLHAKLDAL